MYNRDMAQTAREVLAAVKVRAGEVFGKSTYPALTGINGIGREGKCVRGWPMQVLVSGISYRVAGEGDPRELERGELKSLPRLLATARLGKVECAVPWSGREVEEARFAAVDSVCAEMHCRNGAECIQEKLKTLGVELK